MGEKLHVQHEHGNVHDPFAMTLSVKRSGSFVEWEIVGHLPREISRFCYYFLNYGGALKGRVRDQKYRASPIPSGGIEILIMLVVRLHQAGQRVFTKMKGLLQEYYVEPEEAQVNVNEEIDVDFDLDAFQPAEENYQGEENAAGQNDDVAEDGDGDAGVIAIEDDSENEIEGQDQIVIDD